MRGFLGLVVFGAAYAQDPLCSPNGIPGAPSQITGVSVNFNDSIITCNRLGGFAPAPDEPGFTPDCTVDELRYTNIGTDFGFSTGPSDNVVVDLVITNLTNYIPNNALRNGRTSEQTGEFGQVNMADDQLTRFAYRFVETGTNTPVTFSTPFDFFFYDIDVGEQGRLAEVITIAGALRVTDIEDACRDQNQPSPCLSGTVIIQNIGGNSFTCIGTERGYGADNADTPQQILQPVADMSEFDKVAARKYVNVSFPAGLQGFEVEYSLTASADPGFSGRNFQYTIFGESREEETFFPCYFCPGPPEVSCETCGGFTGIPCDTAYRATCENTTAYACQPGDPSYPDCKDECAIGCEEECASWVCSPTPGQDFCVECGIDPTCLPGTECYDTTCTTGTTFETKASCEAAQTCIDYTCHEFECKLCGGPDCLEGSACFQENCLDTSPADNKFDTIAECEAVPCTKYTCDRDEFECKECGGTGCEVSTDPNSCYQQFCENISEGSLYDELAACVADGCSEYTCDLTVFECKECGGAGCEASTDPNSCFQRFCENINSIPGGELYPSLGVCRNDADTNGCTPKYACISDQCILCGQPGCEFGSACFNENCLETGGFPNLNACNSECSSFVCDDYECKQCGSPECSEDEASDPNSCFAKFCADGSTGPSYPTLESCQRDGCEKIVCESETTQMCYECKSDYIESLEGPDGVHYCDDKITYDNIGSCQTVCSPPVARKDPHLYLPHGGRADFRGADNVTFAMLSAKDVAFNVKFEEADFNWAKRVVHGTKMAAAYWTIRTTGGKMLHIEYNANSKLGGIVREEGKRDVTIMANSPALVVDNVHVSLENQKLTVEVGGKWLMTAAVAAFPFGNLAANKHKKLLDIGVEALYDADHDVVAPHGIFGQAYDGDNIGVSGKVDTRRTVETTTVAQAEGAIEGVWSDYMVASPFATAFKYSRFDATEAKPRDVSKLSGKKTPMPATAYSVGASDLPEVV